jgi:hypothetical protein
MSAFLGSPDVQLMGGSPRGKGRALPHGEKKGATAWHGRAQGHKEGLQRKVAERQADLRARREQLSAAHADNEAMRARIAAQTISRDDVIRMNHERRAFPPPHCPSFGHCRQGTATAAWHAPAACVTGQGQIRYHACPCSVQVK